MADRHDSPRYLSPVPGRRTRPHCHGVARLAAQGRHQSRHVVQRRRLQALPRRKLARGQKEDRLTGTRRMRMTGWTKTLGSAAVVAAIGFAIPAANPTAQTPGSEWKYW